MMAIGELFASSRRSSSSVLRLRISRSSVSLSWFTASTANSLAATLGSFLPVSSVRNTTFENLRAAGSTSLPITRGVIEALRDEPDQDLLARRLASEVALASVLEKALLLQRTLLTGKKEPNVAANQLAVEAVNHESDTLDQEIRNL